MSKSANYLLCRMVLGLIIVWGALLPMEAWGRCWVFVSAASDKKLHLFEFEPTSGELTHRSELELPGEPGALAMRSDRRLMIVALRAQGQLASVEFDPDSAQMRLINVVPAGDDPAHVAFDPGERSIITAYYVAGKVSLHSIGDDGSLSQQAVQEIETARYAHAIVFDPSGQSVYVPHTGSNRIVVLDWDEREQRLTERPELLVQTNPNTGPRHAVWSRDGSRLIVDFEQANEVAVYERQEDGSLKSLGSTTTLPEGWEESNATAEIRRHPIQDWVLVSNRGHNSIAIIDVSQEPRWLSTIETESVPRSFDITSDGRYLIVAGEASGNLSVHRLEGAQAIGAPQRLELGPRLWSVLVVE